MNTLLLPRNDQRPRGLALYPYQQQALDAVFSRAQDGVTRQVVSMPTGAGKTILACHIIDTARRPAVMVVHRDELVNQTLRKLAEFDPGLSVAICKADLGRKRHELAGYDVVLASVQTLARESRLATLVDAVGTGGLLIVDECHHAAAESYRQTVTRLEPSLLVGLTATPKRADGKGLDGIFDEIVYALPMRDLVEIGKLARPIGIRIGTGVSLDGVRSRGGDFIESEVSAIVNSEARNGLVVDAWAHHARDAGRTRAIAFCVDVAHCYALQQAFIERGCPAEVVVGTTPASERAALYRALHDGSLPVLISCLVLTEGFDEPLADCALMCRPTQSQALYVQMAGRVLRAAPGKPDAVILDFVDNTARHALQTILTLAGDDAHFAGTPRDDDPLDLFGAVDAAMERVTRVRKGAELLGDLLGCAPVAWQQARGHFFVGLANRQYIAVIQTSGGYLPIRMTEDDYALLYGYPVDAETAMNVAQREVPVTATTKRDARWRVLDVPATDAQYKAARAARVRLPDGCTKGQASGLIDVGFFLRALHHSQADALEEIA